MSGIVSGITDFVFGKPPDPPAPPNPYQVADAQAGYNADTARLEATLNRYDQTSPYGNLTWSQGPNDKWTSSVSLSPEMQNLFDKYIDTSEALTNYTGQGIENVGQLFQPGNQPRSDTAYRDQIVNELYGKYTDRLDPRFDKEENSLKSMLLNQGITLGSDAYSNALDDFGRTKTDAYQQAMRDAIISGQSTMQNQVALDQQTRNQILNELNALRTGSQVTNPTFSNQQVGTNVATTPFAQSAYNSFSGMQDLYNAEASQYNQNMQNVMDLGKMFFL